MHLNFKKIATAVSATAATFAMSAAFSITAEALDAPVITGQTGTYGNYVSFQWNPVNGANKYVTRYSYDGGATWINESGSTSRTDDTIYSLNAGGSYLVQVASTTYDGQQSPWSAPFEVVTIPSDDNIVTNSTALQTGATVNSATFNWGAAPGATGYRIYTRESNGQYTLIGSTDATSFTATGLTPDTEYKFYVSPFKQSASGYIAEHSYFPYVYVTTLAKAPSVKADASYSITNASFVLPATNADGYRVRFYNQKGKLITEKFENGLSSYEPSVHPGKSVCNYGVYRKVKVASYLTLNNKKVYSKTTTKSFIFQPKVNLKQKTGMLAISWKKVPKATKYEVYVSYNKNDGYKKVATLSNKKTSYTLKKFRSSKISNNKTYYVYVKPIAKGATSVCTTCWYQL